MSKVGDSIGGIKSFVEEVHVEMRKCAWPTREELMESTVVTIVATILFGVFVGVSDFGLVRFVGWLISTFS